MISLLIGTVLAVLFIVQLKRGEKYYYLVESLDDDAFPAKDLYVVGFAWSLDGPIKMGQTTSSKLKTSATLLYSQQYAEYYANIAWAQTIAFVHLILTYTFLLACFMDSIAMMIFAAGLFLAFFAGAYFLTDMENKVKSRTENCDMELPEVVSTMAILVNSGMVLKEAWRTIAYSREGDVYKLMQNAVVDMNNGFSDSDAIYRFGRASNSTEIKKFTSALLQSMEKGGGDLSSFLAAQSSELWTVKRQKLLQEGEKAATKLLAPIVIIFTGIIIIVMTAAFAGSLF